MVNKHMINLDNAFNLSSKDIKSFGIKTGLNNSFKSSVQNINVFSIYTKRKENIKFIDI